VEAERFAGEGPLQAAISLRLPSAPDAAAAAVTGSVTLRGEGSARRGTAYLTVPHPQLWWTHDLGSPTLYDLTVTLTAGGPQGAVTVDQRRMQVVIRTLALDQSPDPAEPGPRFFRFVLNGVPLFARGANWIPAQSFV